MTRFALQIFGAVILGNVLCPAKQPSAMKISLAISKAAPMALAIDFENSSDQAIHLWTDSNSWGWENLAIVVMRQGNPHFYRRTLNEGFTRNVPRFDVIEPGKSLGRVINLADGSWICSGQPLANLMKTDTIIALYAVPKSTEGSERNVWSGVACGATGGK